MSVLHHGNSIHGDALVHQGYCIRGDAVLHFVYSIHGNAIFHRGYNISMVTQCQTIDTVSMVTRCYTIDTVPMVTWFYTMATVSMVTRCSTMATVSMMMRLMLRSGFANVECPNKPVVCIWVGRCFSVASTGRWRGNNGDGSSNDWEGREAVLSLNGLYRCSNHFHCVCIDFPFS